MRSRRAPWFDLGFPRRCGQFARLADAPSPDDARLLYGDMTRPCGGPYTDEGNRLLDGLREAVGL